MENELRAGVNYSGNSDVDVNIQIDMVSMAYMYACSLLATERIDERQFDEMIEKFQDLMKNQYHQTEPTRRIENDTSKVRLLRPVKKLRR